MRHGKLLYRALGIHNVAIPGDSHHGRFFVSGDKCRFFEDLVICLQKTGANFRSQIHSHVAFYQAVKGSIHTCA